MSILRFILMWVMWGLGFWAGFLRGRMVELKACNEMQKKVYEILQETHKNCDQCSHRWQQLLWKLKEDAADD